jgi:hypothetical protein
MKKLIFSAVFFTASALTLFAQSSFEGQIKFREIKGKDTLNTVFYVLGDKVKMDKINPKTKTPDTTYIANVNYRSMQAIDHGKKKYINKNTNTPTEMPPVTWEKTKNLKTINGYKCTEYIVTNEDEGIEISYWLGKGKFDFYEPFESMLNSNENIFRYLLLIENISAMIPFEAVEKIKGEEKTKLEVITVKKDPPEEYIFAIPKDYVKFTK